MARTAVTGRLAFAGFVAALAFALAAALGVRLGLASLAAGTAILHAGTVASLGGVIAGLVWAIQAANSDSPVKARYGLNGLIGSAIIAGLSIAQIYAAYSSPPLHDISSDIANPPAFEALLAVRKGVPDAGEYDGGKSITWQGKTKTAAEWQRKYYTDVHTIGLIISPAEFYKRALRAVGHMGWHVVAQDPNAGRIEATDTSLFFGLTDDIVIRIRPSGMGAKLDIRSASRAGKNDGGRNANAIRDFIKALKKG